MSMAISPAALAMMMQGKSNPRALLSHMVAEMAEDDPQFAMVSQYLAMQSDEAAAATEIEFQSETALPAQEAAWINDGELMSLRDEVAEVQAALDERAEQLQDLADRNAGLAAALGACATCWGEDPACAACHGRGVPGSMRPHKKFFDYYVAPLLARLKSRSVQPRQDSDAGT
jgi:hypothetical protein